MAIDFSKMTREEMLEYRIMQCQQLLAAVVELYGQQTVSMGKVLDLDYDTLDRVCKNPCVDVSQDDAKRTVRITRGG